MPLDWWTLGLQTVNVVVLVWLLSRFLFRPVARIVAERQQAAARLLDEAAQAREAARAERSGAEAARQRLADERAEALRAVEQDVAATRERLLQAAQAEAEALQRQAEAAIAASRQALQQAMEARAGRLALDIAGRLLERLPREARVAGFVEGLADALRQLPEGVRRDLAGQDEPLRLHVPRRLEDSELAACQAALTQGLGSAPGLEQCVTADLVAGLELEGRSAVVRNSFRADLARLERELLHDAG